MKGYDLEKSLRIVSDLAAFCGANGADKYEITLDHEDAAVYKINVNAFMPPLAPEVMKKFSEQLNLPRQRDLEQDFWELTGESEMTCEISLDGMMIDSAEVEYAEGALRIHALRYVNP